MKLPSLNHIYQKATITLRRFPFTLASAAVATGIIIYLMQVSLDQDTVEQILGKITLCGFLGIPLFTVITLVAEKKEWSGSYWWISHAVGLALLIAYYFTLPADLNGPHYIDIYRYGLFILGVHLLVAIGPYLGKSSQMAFWQYNKLLFLRFLTAILFSSVLYIGLAVALLSIQVLLGVDIKYEIYIQLYTFIGVMFNTWFFLAGIPTSLQVFAKRTGYPKGLKIFSQNVLLPLVVVYLAILYAYMIKIVIQWSWPKGWIAILVLSFSIVGILAILLLYPLRRKAGQKWIDRFYTGYFAALVPLVILLLLAIYRRIADYGITINRYFVIILALWLAGMIVYSLASKVQNIKVIPASLCVLVFLISFGPWGAFSVSQRSQVHRLASYLKKNDILQNGTIQKAPSNVSNEDQKQIKNILKYLNNTNSLVVIQPWFSQSLTTTTITLADKDSLVSISHYQRDERVLELMGIERHENANILGHNAIPSYRFYSDDQQSFPVQDMRWYLNPTHWSNDVALKRTFSLNDRKVTIESQKNNLTLHIYYNDEKQKGLRIAMDSILRELQKHHSTDEHALPAKDLTFTRSNQNLNVKLFIHQLKWLQQKDGTKQINGTFSVALK